MYKKKCFIIFCIVLFQCLSLSFVSAMPEYAEETRQGCNICHLASEGGDLNETGLEFAASGYVWPPEGGFKMVGPIKKGVRFFIGFLHLFTAFFWFGTILYVHIMLRPRYASKGLPRGEVILGLTCMLFVGITGTLLTISKINDISVLYESRWGILLSVKILLYLLMVSSAVFMVTIIGPKLKRGKKEGKAPLDGIFCPQILSGFDGKNARPAYIAFKGNVYDVSELRMWKNGMHMKRHQAGQDLTGELSKAPHGEDKIEELKVVGKYDSSKKPLKTAAQKTFYFVAYMNLTVVFAILVVLSLWKWAI